jgi:N-acetylglucosamine-6-phosphate deacetylase
VKIEGRIVRSGAVTTGSIETDGSTITGVHEHDTWATDFVLPGFVDIHCHGGGGFRMTTGDPTETEKAANFHLNHGSTTLLASLVSSPFELMKQAVEAYRPLIDNDVIKGLHFEGPYLSTIRCGAQNPEYLRDPSEHELTELIKGGAVRMVTIAPERPGALDAIRMLVDHGVTAAIGHTDASYEQVLKGIEAGATVGTHLFNGMPPMHHREPGPVVALLDSPTVICELIADGIHLHDGTLLFAAHASKAALITDAMDAAGMPDGDYELGGQAVEVRDRVARLARNGSIAGSTLTMDAALRRAVDAGLDLPTASTMASATPARALGLLDEVGTLDVGKRADLVLLDDNLRVKRVMKSGSWVG